MVLGVIDVHVEIDLAYEIINLISLKREGEYWDFKEKHHVNKADLLHDIICMANNRVDRDGYLIFGVSDTYEIKGVANDENRRNQQGIIDFLKSKKFAGGIRPIIELITLKVANMELDVLIIKNTNDTPYYLSGEYKEDKRTVRENYIYTRVGDTNTDIDKSADINHVEYLWKKRFLLNKPPLEQIKNKLRYPNEWKEQGDDYYNTYNPEFTISIEYDDEYGHPEFYSFLMMNESTSYGTVTLKYHVTTLYSDQFVVLDGGRYITITPQSGFIERENPWDDKYLYKYYVKDSLSYILHEFLLSDDHEALLARDRLYSAIVIFENEQEREAFEQYLELNLQKLNESVEIEACYEWIEVGNEREKKINQDRIKVGKAIRKLLQEYRNSLEDDIIL